MKNRLDQPGPDKEIKPKRVTPVPEQPPRRYVPETAPPLEIPRPEPKPAPVRKPEPVE